MNVALPILLLTFGGLTFWLLTESSIKWYLKVACISAFCLFTVIFWTTLHTFLGWPALKSDMPEKVLIHWVIIKEPNKQTFSKGNIYVLLESIQYDKKPFFGYKSSSLEPRLFGLPYSRDLHEKMEKEVMGKLQRGQLVAGTFTKKAGGKGSDKGSGKGNEGQEGLKGGKGSESQKQDFEFHELLPSQIHSKPQ